MYGDQSTNGFDARHIMRAKAGDAVALKHLLYHIIPRLREVIESNLPNQFRPFIAVEDVIQETSIAIQLRIVSVSTNCPEGFLAWAERLAENKLRAFVRVERDVNRLA